MEAQLRLFFKRYGACPGRGSHAGARRAEAVIEETRTLLAQLFGVTAPERIAFTLNATDALNMAIKGVLTPGAHVVTTTQEHNSVSRPLYRLAQQGFIKLTRVPANREGLVHPKAMRAALKTGTRLVAMAHASNVTGALQPVAAVGHAVRRHGALFLVDAAQTAGTVPIDVEAMRIDLLAFPGHKALLGPPGTGGLYVGPRAHVAAWREGGTGVLSELPYQPQTLPLRLEAGSPNTLGIALWGEALRFLLQEGMARVRARKVALVARLLAGLRGDERMTIYGPTRLERRIAVVSLRLQRWHPQAAADVLDQRFGIAVRAGLHCAPGAHQNLGTFPEGTLRISPGYFTTEGEIDKCLAALRTLADAP